MKGGIVDILVVDDDNIDRHAVHRAVKKQGGVHRLVEAGDGKEALEILRGEHPDKQLIKPYIVLLDLSMPRMGGLEFLEELRADATLSTTLVYVLTTSDAPEDVEEAYRRHISGYIVKNRLDSSFTELLTLLDAVVATIQFPG